MWVRRELRAPACVLVVTQDESVARWASRPIVTGPCGIFQPLVLGPRSVPIVDTVEEARVCPELAVLSSMAHGGGPVETAVNVALAASTAVLELDRSRFLLYFGLIMAALSKAARKAFEMHPEGIRFYDESQQKWFDRGFDRGREAAQAESKVAAVLAVLRARELEISEAQRARIQETSDLEVLDRWIERAARVKTVEALFE